MNDPIPVPMPPGAVPPPGDPLAALDVRIATVLLRWLDLFDRTVAHAEAHADDLLAASPPSLPEIDKLREVAHAAVIAQRLSQARAARAAAPHPADGASADDDLAAVERALSGAPGIAAGE